MRILATLLVCAALIPVSASAQSSMVRFGLHANGATINVEGPLKEVYGAGFGGGAHLDFSFMMFSLRFSGDYVSFSPDNDKYRQLVSSLIGGAGSSFSISGGNIAIISGHANGKLQLIPLPVLSPYITGGVGLARISVDEAKVTQNGTQVGSIPGVKSETNALVNAGVGLDLTLGVQLFLEARYTWIFTEGETSTYIPVTLGITF